VSGGMLFKYQQKMFAKNYGEQMEDLVGTGAFASVGGSGSF